MKLWMILICLLFVVLPGPIFAQTTERCLVEYELNLESGTFVGSMTDCDDESVARAVTQGLILQSLNGGVSESEKPSECLPMWAVNKIALIATFENCPPSYQVQVLWQNYQLLLDADLVEPLVLSESLEWVES